MAWGTGGLCLCCLCLRRGDCIMEHRGEGLYHGRTVLRVLYSAPYASAIISHGGRT